VRGRAGFDKLSNVTQLDDGARTDAAAAPAASFVLNGTPVAVYRKHPHLLAALREELDVTSPKDGCSPSGQCGCCTVLIDGKAVVSCQQSLAKTAGRTVTTLEGVPEAERTSFANAFAACGGLQCGFCIPGIVMRAKAQIDKKGADLQPEDMARHLGAHLCRCTGYVKILEAIDAVAKGKQFEPQLASTVGGAGAKYEAAQLTLGDRDYIDDMRVPGMLHAALHLTAHARAEIVSIDASAALAAPGVIAAFTAADIPGELRVGIIHKDWPAMIPVGGRTSYAGDVLAVVVAETRQQARDAAALVTVEYGVLPPVTDPQAALAADAPVAVWGTNGNVLGISEYSRGDVDAAHEGYRRPLERAARALARAIGPRCDVVLLGSIATGKYVDVLHDIFGQRFCYPVEFIGRGDMSRGGLMLRSAEERRELEYVSIDGRSRRGSRPPRLPKKKRTVRRA